MGRLDLSKDPSGVSVLIETTQMVESSRSNLRAGWRYWLEWCREHGFGPLEGRGGYVPSSGGESVILVDVVQAAVSRTLLDGRVSASRSSVKVR